mgnify:CR=1 FL=1
MVEEHTDYVSKGKLMSFKHELFASPIWGFSWINAPQLQIMKDTVKQLSTTQRNRDKSNFLGWQSSDDLHLHPAFEDLRATILTVANGEIAEQFPSYDNRPFTFESMWANVNYPGAFNLAHIHGAELSGVFYVDVPDPADQSGRIVLVAPRQRVNMSEKRIKTTKSIIP